MTAQNQTEKPRREIACAKCGHLNLARTNSCAQCSARLYILCHHCGHSNERAADRCLECDRRLHRSSWRKLRKRIFGSRSKVSPFQILLLIFFVLMAYKVIVYVAEYRMPAPEI